MVEMKKCNKCGEEKEICRENFHWRKDNNKFRNECIICFQHLTKKYLNKNKKQINIRRKINRIKNKNKINYRANLYYINNKEEIAKRNKKRYLLRNQKQKEKKIMVSKIYNEKNKDKIINYKKMYYLKNKDKILLRNDINSKNNKEKRNKSLRNSRKNPIVMLRHNISTNIREKLKNKKNGSISNYLPYTINELKLYLESKFESWMTWENHGKYIKKMWNDNDKSTWRWQIDHIIPHSLFKYDSMEHPDFLKCWTLENLRPYSAKQNVLDGTNKTRHKVTS